MRLLLFNNDSNPEKLNTHSMDTDKYIADLKEQLLKPDNWQPLVMSRQWTAKIPTTAGVYVLKEGQQIVYVGETGNLRERMNDLLDSRHHTIRRTIGEKFYSTKDGFVQATTKNKFPEHIEVLVNNHICTKLSLAYLEVPLGRKELEESIETVIEADSKLNKRGKRK